MRPIRVLFVGRTIVHFSLFESIVTALLARGAQVELLFNEAESRNWKGGDLSVVEDYVSRHPSLKTGWLIRRSDRWRALIFALRELRSYRSYMTRPETTPFYVKRARRILDNTLAAKWKPRIDQPLVRRMLGTTLAECGLRLAEALVPPDPGIVRFLEERDPDVVLFSPLNMRFSEETDYLKAAKRLGVPTALHVLTWDNLSTKGLVQLIPDVVCLWNELQHRDAVEIHGIPDKRIRVTGSPFFDPWFGRPNSLMSREAFLRSLGFDPERRVLLYLGSSQNIAADETWFVEAVRDALDASADPLLRGCQMLVRPHFANSANYGRLARAGLTVWPAHGALPERRQDLEDMQNSFFHADATLGINSSSMITSILIGLPTYSVRIERYCETQADSKHFRHLESLGAMHYLASIPALLEAFAAALRGEDPKTELRRDFARRFARPHGLDRPAGDVVADTVLAAARRP